MRDGAAWVFWVLVASTLLFTFLFACQEIGQSFR